MVVMCAAFFGSLLFRLTLLVSFLECVLVEGRRSSRASLSLAMECVRLMRCIDDVPHSPFPFLCVCCRGKGLGQLLIGAPRLMLLADKHGLVGSALETRAGDGVLAQALRCVIFLKYAVCFETWAYVCQRSDQSAFPSTVFLVKCA